MQKKRLLLVNDDGINAPGIQSLYNAVKDHYEITVVAPLGQKSGSGLSTTLIKPLHLTKTPFWKKDIAAWHVNGTPADCVKLALTDLFTSPPDLIISGINRGSNAGRSVLYSGTIGGVIEGIYRNNLTGIAFSAIDYEDPQYDEFAPYILSFIEHFLKHRPPEGSLINVNFPSLRQTPIQGVRFARQGQSFWSDSPDRRLHPDGEPYFWLGGAWKEHKEHEESDVSLLRQGFITAVPIHVNELTDLAHYQNHKQLFDESFSRFSKKTSDSFN